MAFEKITNEDTQNKGVVGLADTPGFSASEMQNKFEELSKEVIIPKFNKLVDELNENDVDKAVSSPDITNVRLSSDNTIQVSTNHGISFEETASNTP